MNETDKAWAAGIIEGEASVRWDKCGRPEDTMYAYISVMMADEKAVRKLSAFFGGGVHIDKTSASREDRKTLYRWAVIGKRARSVCRAILPYVVGEKKQIIQEISIYYKKFIRNKIPVRD